jgi:deoxyribodipyrimidine photo-lyase
MEDNAEDLKDKDVLYYPYVETKEGKAEKLLFELARSACIVVTDEFPSFVYPKWVKRAGKEIDVLLEQVDSNGIVPLRAPDQVHKTAYSFRGSFQKDYCEFIEDTPKIYPFRNNELPRLRSLPQSTRDRWPSALQGGGKGINVDLSGLPIDHDVSPCGKRGGRKAAEKQWKEFLEKKLKNYAEHRNEPEKDVTSGVSPYLHHGHISAHQIMDDIAKRENWSLDMVVGKKGKGKRSGWWGMSEPAESFLDEAITWREVGYNMSFRWDDYDDYNSLPDWAKETLEKHRKDEREHVYSSNEFESAETHDELWNAAQRQLVTEGIIHNYLRMLWGKKILEWTKKPKDALGVMIHLNNRYALDGRNPNSYSGIFWCLGRYDRPWGPERPVFGTVRYMSSENTARKVKVKGYIGKYEG